MDLRKATLLTLILQVTRTLGLSGVQQHVIVLLLQRKGHLSHFRNRKQFFAVLIVESVDVFVDGFILLLALALAVDPPHHILNALQCTLLLLHC